MSTQPPPPPDFEALAGALRAEAIQAGPAACEAALRAAHRRNPATGGARHPYIELALEFGHLELARAWLRAGCAEDPAHPGLRREAEWLEAALAELAPPPGPPGGGRRAEFEGVTTAPPGVSPPEQADASDPPDPPDPEARDRDAAHTRDPDHHPRSEPGPHAGPTDHHAGPTDADLARAAHRFSGREGLHARQWFDRPRQRGGYAPVRAPLTPRLLQGHFAGRETLGTYLVRVDNTVTQMVFDLDVTRRAIEASAGQPEAIRRLRRTVAEAGLRLHRFLTSLRLPGLLFDSGYKGRHVWLFCAAPVPASLAFNLGRAVRRVFPLAADCALEVFPKQGQVDPDGLGNLVKIPLGIHQRSGRRAHLLDAEGAAVENPWPTLRALPLVPGAGALLDALEHLKGLPTASTEATEAPGHPPPPNSAPHAPPPDRHRERHAAPPALAPPLDLDAHLALAQIRQGCAVLDHLVRLARGTRRLDHDQRVVVAHALGHLDDGPAVVNALFDHCPETPTHERLRRRLAGNPISCPKIRKRLPEITMHLPCHCAFPGTTDHYATPLLHVAEPRRPAVTPTRDARGELAPWED